MTVGQRIAQKRKELGLSQEALGEQLGVSRQAIYKWESDATLPEIEKLVTLSRVFSVSVGWLLGEEDDPERVELTAEQLRMVEEIVGRYLDARPAPEPEEEEEPPQAKKWRWGRILAYAVPALIVLGLFWSLDSRLNQMRQESQNLQMTVANVRSDVNSQIYGITSRVESILQSQNSLLAEQSARIAAIDCAANTVTVSARVLPRTFVEGMTAEFLLVSGGETVTVPALPGADHAFTAEITGILSDRVTVSAVLLTGEKRETQVLESYSGLYSDSFPKVDIINHLWGSSSRVDEYVEVQVGETDGAQVRVGLFRDQKLLAWYKPCEKPQNYAGFEGYSFFRLEGEWNMESGYVYSIAAVLTDRYGRERVYSSYPVKQEEDREFYGYYAVDGVLQVSSDPADWEY